MLQDKPQDKPQDKLQDKLSHQVHDKFRVERDTEGQPPSALITLL